jgi:hypothetical protein
MVKLYLNSLISLHGLVFNKAQGLYPISLPLFAAITVIKTETYGLHTKLAVRISVGTGLSLPEGLFLIEVTFFSSRTGPTTAVPYQS